MGADSNKAALVRLEEEVFNQGNLDAADDLVAEDAVNHNPVPGESPGPAGMRETFHRMRSAFPDFHVTVMELLADGEWIAERLTISGTHEGDYLGIKASGRRFTASEVNVYRMEDGKVKERWGVVDTPAILAQLKGESVDN